MEKNIENINEEYNCLLKKILSNIKDIKTQIILMKDKEYLINKIREIDSKIEKILNNENKI